MIGTILRINWLNLKRDYVALGMTFILPIVFFSIFALIFGSMGGDGGAMRLLRVAIVDLDGTETSERFVAALGKGTGLRLISAPSGRPDVAFTPNEAEKLVRDGEIPAVVVIPQGFAASFASFTGEATPVELLYDQGNPVASQMVSGLMQRAAMTAAPDLLMTRGLKMLEKYGEPLTDRQREAANTAAGFLKNSSAGNAGNGEGEGRGAGFGGLVRVDAKSIQSDEEGETKSMIAFYAAGTGVMFLLFSMAGAGGALLEEEESGALDRLLTSNIGMGRLLLGKWLFIAALGVSQVVLMFLWGAFVFGIELFTPNHLAGFVVMTLVTAAAAGGFGLLLASLCRTRAQLGGISTIVILIMSAVGGSMFPRFLMPDVMKKIGLATFNGWALDGYLKVFWYEDPNAGVLGSVGRLWPQVLVLVVLTLLFLGAARLFARRWETV